MTDIEASYYCPYCGVKQTVTLNVGEAANIVRVTCCACSGGFLVAPPSQEAT